MKKNTVYIGLGSNIEQPYVQIKNAVTALHDLLETAVIKDSGYYQSKPMGPEDQPDYINVVVEIETKIAAIDLLKNCQQIELQQGRIKSRHWGERTIDLDILLYGDEQIQSDDLIVPHPGIAQRDFVYIPLLKLNPEIIIPGLGLLRNIVENTAVAVLAKKAAKDKNKTDYNCQFVGNIDRKVDR